MLGTLKRAGDRLRAAALRGPPPFGYSPPMGGIPSVMQIIVDTREKKPLLFPRFLQVLHPGWSPLQHKTQAIELVASSGTLACGDYYMTGSRCIVERKGSVDEVCGNLLTHDRKRALASLDRLASACPDPVLMLEGHPHALLSPSTRNPYAFKGVDALMRETSSRRIRLLLLPTSTTDQRRAAGEWVARLLVNSMPYFSPDNTERVLESNVASDTLVSP